MVGVIDTDDWFEEFAGDERFDPEELAHGFHLETDPDLELDDAAQFLLDHEPAPDTEETPFP